MAFRLIKPVAKAQMPDSTHITDIPIQKFEMNLRLINPAAITPKIKTNKLPNSLQLILNLNIL